MCARAMARSRQRARGCGGKGPRRRCRSGRGSPGGGPGRCAADASHLQALPRPRYCYAFVAVQGTATPSWQSKALPRLRGSPRHCHAFVAVQGTATPSGIIPKKVRRGARIIKRGGREEEVNSTQERGRRTRREEAGGRQTDAPSPRPSAADSLPPHPPPPRPSAADSRPPHPPPPRLSAATRRRRRAPRDPRTTRLPGGGDSPITRRLRSVSPPCLPFLGGPRGVAHSPGRRRAGHLLALQRTLDSSRWARSRSSSRLRRVVTKLRVVKSAERRRGRGKG